MHALGTRLFYGAMETVLGLIGLALYIVAILGLSSGVTWLVVRLSPSKSAKELDAKASASS